MSGTGRAEEYCSLHLKSWITHRDLRGRQRLRGKQSKLHSTAEKPLGDTTQQNMHSCFFPKPPHSSYNPSTTWVSYRYRKAHFSLLRKIPRRRSVAQWLSS